MKFGMPTLIETESLEQCASVCRELGLDFIELNMNLPQYQMHQIDVASLRKIAGEYGLFYTIHLDENFNISDFNPYIADAYRRTVLETIDMGQKLEVPVINMHLSRGVYFTLPDEKVYLFARYREFYLQSILDFRQMCEDAIGNAKIMICIENCDGFPEFQKEALSILLDSPVFGLTFDIGHNHSCGDVDAQFILEHRHHLHHMHMHDALGKKNHLAPGTGELAIERYLSLAEEQDCRVVLETKTIEGLKQSVSWLRAKRVIW